MRQIISNGTRVLVARMPRPIVEPGSVLVRVHCSLISVGTEIAPLRAGLSQQEPSVASRLREMSYNQIAKAVLGRAASTSKAALKSMKESIQSSLPSKPAKMPPPLSFSEIQWIQQAARNMDAGSQSLSFLTDDSESLYQVQTQPIPIPEGLIPVISFKGSIRGGRLSLGLLNERMDTWLGSRIIEEGPLDERIIFNTGVEKETTLVFTNAGVKKEIQVELTSFEIAFSPPTVDGLPLNEMDDQGWNLGYSVSGEVVEVGQGITDLAVGDKVACAGAGRANHADYVSVPRNLVCKIPHGCTLEQAAFTTVGSIALQGVRRASPLLGEKVCVIGLGLLGQITTQLLHANGCMVYGLDLAQDRVERALKNGMDDGCADADKFARLVHDRTQGFGADCTIITASAKTSAILNNAMKLTRRKGRVVIVGDIGMEIERPAFYQKEIDLLMSTSYGPGRYDSAYEIEGHDYPYAYVRWTLNRNMQAFLTMCAQDRLAIDSLIDAVIDVTEASEMYEILAKGNEKLPIGILLNYPEEKQRLAESRDGLRISLRGGRKVPDGLINYALVGAGAFGTCMLVPNLAKRRDRFFLRGVVEPDTIRGGNFARTNQVELLSTDMQEVLKHPDIDLVVIATRHNRHAQQVLAALKAGKHVFVEKPLAVHWDELNEIIETYTQLEQQPYLMVGFNRRFSPALQKVKEIVHDRRSPLMINYRLNGGYIPPDSWIQNAEGGGRNIGEACHMYDVFRSLAGAPVDSIHATSIDPSDLPYLRNDNFSAVLRYGDGSVGTLFYTALGPKKGLPKERIEIFCDGETYIVDDFKQLIQAGSGEVLWESPEPDKGHFEELSRYGDCIASGGEPPIPFDEIAETSAVALQIEDLLLERQSS